jgi:site-specific DNA-cytosine methylase
LPEWPKATHGTSSPGLAPLTTFGQVLARHPSGKRRLTVREALRVQGFPDSFKVSDRSSKTDLYGGVGDSVPPNAFRPFLESVIAVLRETDGIKDPEEPSQVSRYDQAMTFSNMENN